MNEFLEFLPLFLGGLLSGMLYQLVSKHLWFVRARNQELRRLRDLRAAFEGVVEASMSPRNEYFPDEVSSPGSILADVLAEQGISDKGAAIRLGCTPEYLSDFFQGKEELTPELCTNLGKMLKVPATLWWNLEHNYRNPPCAPTTDLQELVDKCLQVCKKEGWPLDWSGRGCYIHLEVSEFIEAMRGKGNTSVTEEGADVLFTVFSALAVEGIPIEKVLVVLSDICEGYLEPPEGD